MMDPAHICEEKLWALLRAQRRALMDLLQRHERSAQLAQLETAVTEFVRCVRLRTSDVLESE